MNKTVTINISGIIFHIEEDAFDKLSKYMATIKGYFSKTEGGNEIMSDIEARIAEMLQSKVGPVKQVVLMADVEDVIESMGRPEEFAGEEESTTSNSNNDKNTYTAEETEQPIKRRLYRDPDNKMLGGVCAGIGNYFDFDPTWFRILLALVTFFSFGSLVLVYIILWIVIPEARTTAEKLAMRGEKIDINTISKSVKEEAEQIKKRMEKYGEDIRNYTYENRERPKEGIDRFVHFVKEVFSGLFRFLGRFIGLCLFIFGIILFVIFMSTIFGVSMINNVNLRQAVGFVLPAEDDFSWASLGLILFAGIPIIVMIYTGIKLLFKLRYTNRWLNMGSGIVWAIGLVMVLYVGARTLGDFNESGRIRETVSLTQSDTLKLMLNPIHEHEHDFNIDEDTHYSLGRHRGHFNTRFDSVLYFTRASLNIVPSATDSFELYVIKEADGRDKPNALNNARMIRYKLEQKGNTITFDDAFTMTIKDKWREQNLKVLLKMPKGKVIFLDKKMKYFIYDIENVTNMLDDDMVGHYWKMTEEGLVCLDCLTEKEEIQISSDVNGTITTTSQDGNAKVSIDENGIRINSDDGKVEVNKNGVHIEGKE